VIGAAKMIANGGVRSSNFRRDGDIGSLARLDLGVDLQLAHEEPVCHVFAMQPQSDRLSLLQRDLFRHKPKTLRRDFYHPRFGGIRSMRHGSHSRYQGNYQPCAHCPFV
jgi:hypothetical protein